MKEKPIIALHGSYYGHNYGDVLLMSLFTKWIKEEGFNVVLPFAKDDIKKNINAEFNGVRNILFSKGLIYGGGGYFGEPPFDKNKWFVRNIIRHIPIGEIAKILHKPYAIIGVGVGPISNLQTRGLILRLCRNANILAVRDKESKEYLIEYGINSQKIEVVADAALQLSEEEIPDNYIYQARELLDKLPFEKKIGLHVPKIDREMKNEIINFIKSKPDIGTFILSDDYAKRQINYEIKNQLPENSIIVEYKNPWFLTALIKQIDLVITTKLHVGIVANALNTQVLSIPFHNKTPRFYEQIGKSDYCIPFNQYSKGSIKDMLEYMYLNCSNKHISPEVKKKAYRNKELISEFINLIKRF